MPSKSKSKGNALERQIVNKGIKAGFTSKRGWGSVGFSLGKDKDVDLMIGEYCIQAKSRKKIADYLLIPDSCDFVVFKQDRGPMLALIYFDDLLGLLKHDYAGK